MNTQLFISWSGELSRKVATQLHEWIPSVLQSAEPFLSSTDIEKGSRWSDHVAKKLEECGFGIIVLTPENTSAPWILFEAGALSKMVGRSHVSSLLIQLNLVDVKQPLSQFQNTVFQREDVLKLLHSINRVNETPLKDEVLSKTYAALWPDFEKSVTEIIANQATEADSQQFAPKADDLASLRDSVGELIQTVQGLRDSQDTSNSVSEMKSLLREFRFDTRRPTLGIPRGLTHEMRQVLDRLSELETKVNSDEVIDARLLTEMIDNMTRALNWLERHARRPEHYPRSVRISDAMSATGQADEDN